MAFGNTTSDSFAETSDLSAQLKNVEAGSLAHNNTNKEAEKLSRNRFSDRNRHKKKRGKRQKNTQEDELKSNINLRLATTDARTLPFEEWSENLRGPAKWCSEQEQRAFYEFGYGSSTVSTYVQRRLRKSLFMGILTTIVATIGAPWVMKALTGPKALMFGVVLGIAMIFLTWFMGVHKSMYAYNTMLYERQLVFIKFERLLIPYLSEMKNGVSLFSMLKKVCARLDDESDRKLVQRLMGELAEGANTSEPFVDFARRFGGSDSARLFMLSIYQMYSGNYNDAIVRDLGDQSNEQMMQQVEKIATQKLKRFNHLTTWLTMGSALVIMGYMGAIIANSFKQAVGLMNKNN